MTDRWRHLEVADQWGRRAIVTGANSGLGYVSTLALATWLQSQPEVSRVYYPGLASHPQHALAMRQQSASGKGVGGAVLSFDVKGKDDAMLRGNAFAVIDAALVSSITTNLGDTKTTISHPASTSHGRLTPLQRQAAGIGQGLIRLAVGLENIEDLKTDLLRGFNQTGTLE